LSTVKKFTVCAPEDNGVTTSNLPAGDVVPTPTLPSLKIVKRFRSCVTKFRGCAVVVPTSKETPALLKTFEEKLDDVSLIPSLVVVLICNLLAGVAEVAIPIPTLPVSRIAWAEKAVP
jgi:hypothetical protein